jgi:hypothetical protein
MRALICLALALALQTDARRALSLAPRSALATPHAARARVRLSEHAVKYVIAPRAAMLLRSWQKQAEDQWSQGFTPASSMDKMRRLSAQVKQLQRMAALARVLTLAPTAGASPETHFAPYMSRLPHTSILAAVMPGNGTAIAFAVNLPDSAEILHIESSPVCNALHARNAQAALLDAFIARSADALPTLMLVADAAPGSETETLLIERGFARVLGVEGWMPDFIRYTRPATM